MSDLLLKYGPWAVVTGASDGIGRAIAVSLASQGFNLFVVARRGEILEAMAAQLQQAHRVTVRVHAAG